MRSGIVFSTLGRYPGIILSTFLGRRLHQCRLRHGCETIIIIMTTVLVFSMFRLSHHVFTELIITPAYKQRLTHTFGIHHPPHTFPSLPSSRLGPDRAPLTSIHRGPKPWLTPASVRSIRASMEAQSCASQAWRLLTTIGWKAGTHRSRTQSGGQADAKMQPGPCLATSSWTTRLGRSRKRCCVIPIVLMPAIGP